MTEKDRSLLAQVESIVTPILEEMGFELVDIEYRPERGRWILRLYIDKSGGVTLDDCARVSREAGDLIEVKDLMRHPYTLEVSSPGLDRPLRKEKDFQKVIGKKIRVRLSVPVEKSRNFTGYLRDFRDETIYLEIRPGQIVTLPWKEMEKANLIYEFDS